MRSLTIQGAASEHMRRGIFSMIIDQSLMNKPAGAVCMIVLCMVGCLTACSSIIGQRDDAAILDRELAASIVYVHGNERPEQLNRLVQPGTVVVWLNKCSEDIRIVFPERKVTIACLNPVSFNSAAEGIFESKVLPPGAVASLCFIQPGLYVYAVERLGDDLSGREEGPRCEGSIVVQ